MIKTGEKAPSVQIKVGGDGKRRKTTARKATEGIIGLGIAGLVGWVIFRQLKKRGLLATRAPVVTDQAVQEVTAIAIENIEGIANDVSLANDEKIAIFQATYNEQFTALQQVQEQLTIIENDIATVENEIILIEASFPIYETAIATEQTNVDAAWTAELAARNIWASDNDALVARQAELTRMENEWDNMPLFPDQLLQYAGFAYNHGVVANDIVSLEAIVNTSWTAAYNAEQARITAENNFNAALANFNSFKESSGLNDLLVQKIALTDSLTSWTISFKATEIILQQLNLLVVDLGGTIEGAIETVEGLIPTEPNGGGAT